MINNLEYRFNLEDVVDFQEFYLQVETTSLKLIIEEVYEGEKWDDTCVTGILLSSYSEELDDYKNQTFSSYSTKEIITKEIEEITIKK